MNALESPTQRAKGISLNELIEQDPKYRSRLVEAFKKAKQRKSGDGT